MRLALRLSVAHWLLPDAKRPAAIARKHETVRGKPDRPHVHPVVRTRHTRNFLTVSGGNDHDLVFVSTFGTPGARNETTVGRDRRALADPIPRMRRGVPPVPGMRAREPLRFTWLLSNSVTHIRIDAPSAVHIAGHKPIFVFGRGTPSSCRAVGAGSCEIRQDGLTVRPVEQNALSIG